MRLHDPRSLLLRALLLDWLAQITFFVVIILFSGPLGFAFYGNHHLEVQYPWLLFSFLIYPALGWLFGIYTVLHWRRLAFHTLILRLLLTSTFSFLFVVFTYWLVDPVDQVWFVQSPVLIIWLVLVTACSFLIRIALRRGLLQADSPRFILLANDCEKSRILQAWTRVASQQTLEPILPAVLEKLLLEGSTPLLVILSPSLPSDPKLSGLIKLLETQDPRLVQTISAISLFEQQQKRLPPALLSDTGFSYDELPWASPLSVQVQLKRLADLFVSVVLLLITAPFISLAALLIWLEDRGPVFYRQQRSGWIGRPFTVLKLRTMRNQKSHSAALWTQPGDERITVVGFWLRRLRFDELPQLLNVLSGEMTLIGPRPERPELEHQLERHIPHYRKRHWMRPGLSGWAQVCAPYASSIEDSDLKLSYDLFYLRHFSTWFDLVILFRTVKTVLKAGGR